MTEAENRFAQLIFKYEAFIDELAGQEETKYRSLISYDAGKVNHVISSQQAALMRLEQLDQKREAAAAEAGLSGLTVDLTVPAFTIDMQGAILAVPMAEFGSQSDYIMTIGGDFICDNKQVPCRLLLSPDIRSLNFLLRKLGVDSGE